MKVDILTLFPEIFPGPLGSSIIGRAAEKGLFELRAIDLRSFASDRRGTVDDKPYGGGPGMLMKVEVLDRAIRELRRPETMVILTTPRGRRFDQAAARELKDCGHLLIVCGHYEGVDQRLIDQCIDREYSIGDYVLTSGNLAAMVMVDAIVRLLPGALGCDESSSDETFAEGLLEYPQYTRPPVFGDEAVPDVLLSGDHGRIAAWRFEQSAGLTRERRPELWEHFLKTKKLGGK
ncbi:MAG: tRNA (guanosine(37)-N1)-methyltransferase TrmD [Victivallaceae bacterium]